MRIPSTSDLVHSQANRAYDKLAVISDNIEALQAIYDFIFDIQEYLRQQLKNYAKRTKDENIEGKYTFLNGLRTEVIDFFYHTELDNDIAHIKTGYDGCNPYLLLNVSTIDGDTKIEYKSEVKLTLDLCNSGRALFEVPYTSSDKDYSAVCVKYLNELLDIINARIDALTNRVKTLEDTVADHGIRISNLEVIVNAKLKNILTYPQDNSDLLVTSDGIWEYGQYILGLCNDAINASRYVLPIASSTILGGIKVGDYLIINSNGKLSVDIDAIKNKSFQGDATSFTVPLAFYETWLWYPGAGGSGGHSSGWFKGKTNILANAQAYTKATLNVSDIEIDILYTFGASKDVSDPTHGGDSIVDVDLTKIDVVNKATLLTGNDTESFSGPYPSETTGYGKTVLAVALVTITPNPLKTQLRAAGYEV